MTHANLTYIKRFIIAAAVVLVIFGLPVNSYDPGGAMGDIRVIIPDEAMEYLPESLFYSEGDTASDPGLLVRAAASMLNTVFRPVLSVFASIIGFIIIMSVFAALRQNIMKTALSSAFDFVSTICMALLLYNVMSGLWDEAFAAMDQLNLFMNGMMPVMTSLYAAGGHITTAAASNAGMMALLTLFEAILHSALYPALRVVFGLALVGSVGGINLGGITSLVRNTFTVALSFIMTLLTVVLAYQTKLSLSADNVAARTVKFAAGSFIPIVGGAVGEAVRVVMGGLSYIKTAVGFIAVLVIVLIVLPVILRLFLYKIILGISSGLAKIFGCEREGTFLVEMSGLLNITLALLSSSSVLFILNMTLFIKSASGG
ncbi:MAG: hypothetical protein PHZ09_09405 [Eubacteriales bacterium]|jgi:stage III sporulation protein AE|nr:hypothetical protein [Eubacteriales bacterium]